MFYNMFTVSLILFLAAADDNGLCFGHHCCWRMSPILTLQGEQQKVYNYFFNSMNLLNCCSTVVTEKILARPPTPPPAWHHPIHVTSTRGAGDSANMMMMFVACLCCVLWSHLVVEYRNILLVRQGQMCHIVPQWHAPHMAWRSDALTLSFDRIGQIVILSDISISSSLAEDPRCRQWEALCGFSSVMHRNWFFICSQSFCRTLGFVDSIK